MSAIAHSRILVALPVPSLSFNPRFAVLVSKCLFAGVKSRCAIALRTFLMMLRYSDS